MPEAPAPQLHMLRPDLADLPPVRPPAGYVVRPGRDGDGEHWTRIITAAFAAQPGQFDFEKVMRPDPSYLPERIFFACRGDEPVGTAAAYHRPRFLPDAGMLHYLGVLPAHAGRGLGRPLVAAALGRMRRDGRRRAWLSTDDFRLPAIATYLRAGFEPLLVHENQRRRWAEVFAALGWADLSERFAGLLAGPIHPLPG